MFIIKSPKKLQKKIISLKHKGKKVGFVPTMGSLHKGHLSLVKKARKECDIVVVSIFINPAQFGPHEDLDKYPRNIKKDRELLKCEKVDFLFLPAKEEMYVKEHSLFVVEEKISKVLCGNFREGHFRGVLTVCAKLFNIVQPDRSYFGLKDLQQGYLIKKMVKELNMPVNVVLLPIVREKSGLAMSSRNVYLSDKDRMRSLSLKSSLNHIIFLVKQGVKDVSILQKEGIKNLRKGVDKIDYLEIISLPDIAFPKKLKKRMRIAVLVAAYIGKTRLIDNIVFKV
ncbi:MAG: pantoate--beta-alanine ligase [Candidatus Aureabacteria bacterium]|nr:pantoate--beta-alanine ligase [Candidatus Auribacterota bacterium]